MSSMTEDLGRLAGGIAASRRARMAANVERHREAGNRHRAVGDQLHEIRMMRGKMSREQRRDAAAGRRRGVNEVEALLRQFRRNRAKNAAAARVQAASFVHDLTGRVAALRDAFGASQQARAKLRHELAKALHERLAGYRQDRHDAVAAWHGTPARHPRPTASVSAHRPTAEQYAGRAGTSHAKPSGDTGTS